MSRISLFNALAVLIALGLSMSLGFRTPSEVRAPSREGRGDTAPRELVDATGTTIVLRDFERIASASTVADRLLLELCEATRVHAVTDISARGRDAHRYGERARIRTIDDTEEIVALGADLLVVHNVADPRRVERLREAGLLVFDLGPLEGTASLREDIVQIGTLCGARERGRRFADSFERRLAGVARGVPEPHRRAIYLATYGGRLFGGTVGTSYHDVLVAAGLEDVAATGYDGWPQYSVEQVLELDPPLLVTRPNMTGRLCRSALANLDACRTGNVIEIEEELLDDPGLGMLDAAEILNRAAYP